MRANGPPRGFQPAEIEAAVAPMLLQPLSPHVYSLLGRYLDLLSRWNQKMNLTAVRDPGVLVGLHLGECLRSAQRIPSGVENVLDFGSGAGFPGIPIQIVHPQLHVTLAESQMKKASFLREAVRELGLSGAIVHAGRVEDMPETSVFDLVTLRAVDKMGEALRSTIPRIYPPKGSRRGWCMILTSRAQVPAVIAGSCGEPGVEHIQWKPVDLIPGTAQRVVLLGSRVR